MKRIKRYEQMTSTDRETPNARCTPVRYRVRVEGMVQGVWFRQSTREVAEELGVNGWVRNLSDGSVEAVIEGEQDKVAALLDWLHHGPPAAIVTRVTAQREEPQGEQGFRVLR